MSPTSNHDLPTGWIQQYDHQTHHPFWVDTSADPPRSIWVHPYEDEQFLSEHPDIRDRLKKGESLRGPEDAPPPPYTPRRHSFSGSTSHTHRRNEGVRNSASQPVTPGPSTDKTKDGKHRGFFGKIKDKAIGTKEEREELRRQEILAEQQYAEQRRRQRLSSPYVYGAGPSGYGMGPPPFGPVMYRAPAGNPYTYGQPGYGSRYENRDRYGNTNGGFGAGGLALPILGGLAGGLLLGDILGGGLF